MEIRFLYSENIVATFIFFQTRGVERHLTEVVEIRARLWLVLSPFGLARNRGFLNLRKSCAILIARFSISELYFCVFNARTLFYTSFTFRKMYWQFKICPWLSDPVIGNVQVGAWPLPLFFRGRFDNKSNLKTYDGKFEKTMLKFPSSVAILRDDSRKCLQRHQ